MGYLGSWKIDDYLTFYCNTHTVTTGAATDADAVPPYRVYEDETGAAITNANMALLDAANTVGFYSERIQLTAVTGFEKGKQYVIYIAATVNAVVGTISHTFQIEAEVDANTVSVTVDSNLVEMGGVAQSATDLKDFADAGYDPATNKVEGVKLADTTTTNTDMRGTDGANTVVPPTEAQMNTGHALLATPAEVNAEVLDVLNVDTFAQPGQEAPAATTTLAKMIAYLYKFMRNRITSNRTTGELSVYAADESTVDHKATFSDNTTVFDRGEMGTGA